MKRIKIILLVCSVFIFIFAVFLMSGSPSQNEIPEGVDRKISSEAVTPKENGVYIMLGGDVMLGRNVMQTTIKNGNYEYPFEKIFTLTSNSDIFFVNLENPIIENCPTHLGGFKFCAPPEMIAGLKKANINVVSLANNHSRNYGQDGLTQTRGFLEKEGISSTGINNLVIKNIGDISIGFIGFDFTVFTPTDSDYQLVSTSNDAVDYLIVGIHWGNEYESLAGKKQKEWAREIIGRGADIIVGHHPHWVQDYECIDSNGNNQDPESICDAVEGKPVYYSLGNLVFDQMWSEETKKGMLVRLKLNGRGIVRQDWFSTYIKNVGQPEISESTNK